MLPIFTILQKPYPQLAGAEYRNALSPLVLSFDALGLVKLPGLQCLLEMEIDMLEFQ